MISCHVFLVLILFQVTSAYATKPVSKENDALVYDDCVGDYSPCICVPSTLNGERSLKVFCDNITSVEAVKDVFQRNPVTKLSYFSLTIPSLESNATVPPDLLHGTSAYLIRLNCASNSMKLTVHPDAFPESNNFTNQVTLGNCDLQQLDHIFLKNFYALDFLFVTLSNHVSQWTNLPLLPSLQTLSVETSTDFQDFDLLPVWNLPNLTRLYVNLCSNFQFLPKTLPHLKELTIAYCPLFKQWDVVTQLIDLESLSLFGFTEKSINDALDAVISSSLANKITILNLIYNGLKEVPTQMQAIINLKSISLMNNQISVVKAGAFTFKTPIKDLDLIGNQLVTIEPNPFKGTSLHVTGDFSNSQIYLDENQLSRFESSVFQDVLNSMIGKDGTVSISYNPMECGCDLEWLFTDANRLLATHVFGGQCSDGTAFDRLSHDYFNFCHQGGSAITFRSQTSVINYILLSFFVIIIQYFLCLMGM